MGRTESADVQLPLSSTRSELRPDTTRTIATKLVCGVAWILGAAACAAPVTLDPLPGRGVESASACSPIPLHVIAHRGASAYAPENTLVAFEIALELGASEVELDVQLSRDDVVMLYHDTLLETKAGEAGRVRDYSAARLQDMEIGAWFDRTHPDRDADFAGTHLDTLDQLFEAFGSRLYFHVELKSPDPKLPRLTLEAIDRAQLGGRVRITSFQLDQLRRSIERAPNLPHTLLVRDASDLRADAGEAGATVLELQRRKVDLAMAEGFDQIGIASEDLSPELMRYAKARGITVRAWRIRGDADMNRAIDMGVSGMTTNWPDRLIRRLDQLSGDPHCRPRPLGLPASVE